MRRFSSVRWESEPEGETLVSLEPGAAKLSVLAFGLDKNGARQMIQALSEAVQYLSEPAEAPVPKN